MDFRGVVSEIIRETSYKLNDFYLKTFLEGGITLEQANTLFEELQKIKHQEFKIQAALQGVDLNSKDGEENQNKRKDKSSKTENSSMVFGDPKDYEHLSKEEREDLTKKMLEKHQRWANEKVFKSTRG